MVINMKQVEIVDRPSCELAVTIHKHLHPDDKAQVIKPDPRPGLDRLVEKNFNLILLNCLSV
jgi:hypothetical protein